MTEIIRYAEGVSTLGPFVAAVSEHGVVAMEFGQAGRVLDAAWRAGFAHAELVEDEPTLAPLLGRLAQLVEQPGDARGLALDMRGSGFEQQVWSALRDVPSGATVSYGVIASRIGAPHLAREVAAACAANRLAILVPCHRVLRKDGSISGYRWGVRRKRALLAREHAAAARPPEPAGEHAGDQAA